MKAVTAVALLCLMASVSAAPPSLTRALREYLRRHGDDPYIAPQDIDEVRLPNIAVEGAVVVTDGPFDVDSICVGCEQDARNLRLTLRSLIMALRNPIPLKGPGLDNGYRWLPLPTTQAPTTTTTTAAPTTTTTTESPETPAPASTKEEVPPVNSETELMDALKMTIQKIKRQARQRALSQSSKSRANQEQ